MDVANECRRHNLIGEALGRAVSSAAPTDHAQLLALEYERFVEFGQVLDRAGRRYLVEYIRHQLEPDRPLPPDLDDAYFRYFRDALGGVLTLDALVELCRKNAGLRRQVATDTMKWLRQTYQELRENHPYENEVSRLTQWTVTPTAQFADRYPILLTYLQQTYTEDELPVGFFKERFGVRSSGFGVRSSGFGVRGSGFEVRGAGDRTASPITAQANDSPADNSPADNSSAPNSPAADPPAPNSPAADPPAPNSPADNLEPLIRDLLAQWDALLNAKILAHQLDDFKAKVEEFQDLMEAKVAEYTKLIKIVSPFSDYLSGYWDMSRSLWQDTSFDVLEHYADLLAREDELRELADMLGQWREAEIELEEETLEKTIVRQRWVRDPQMRSEISGVHESSDLNTLLSSEAALLGDAATESAFLKRFADGQLLTFRYDDRKLVTSTDHETEVYNKVREKERGPFILCVDTSESMSGRPEQVAKVLALGILKMAGRVGRRAYLINFSTGIQTLDLHDVTRSLEDIAAFLRMSFHGGTDISLPLYECFRQLRGDDYRDADVLVISDFIMYKLDRDIVEDMRHFQHNKATEFHALVLGEHANEEIVGAFDTTWQYDGAGVVQRVARDILAPGLP